MNNKTFSFRFDIDSLADIEVGVPALIDLAKELNIKFTFFANMGRSFNWRTIAMRQYSRTPTSKSDLHTVRKLGLWRTIRTVMFNPNVGLSHREILFKLLDEGHELALHGGMDHPLWQWELEKLSKEEINNIMRPAYDHFVKLFGKPKGFASPGFRYNSLVLELMDDYGFEYASDMQGERPFVPKNFSHLQIPVNVIGPDKKPFIEQLMSSGLGEEDVVARCKAKVDEVAEKNELAVIYGHPACEGTFGGLRELFTLLKVEGCQVVPMMEIMGTMACLRQGE